MGDRPRIHNSAISLALLLGIGRVAAGCSKDENDAYHCTGISWTTRMWIIIGAAIVFVVCNVLAIALIRRHYRNKRRRLPQFPGSRVYQPGEWWENRREHLPGYKAPEERTPTVISDGPRLPNMSQAQAALSPTMTLVPPLARRSSRSSRISEQLPIYETTATPALPVLRSIDSDSTLAETRIATPAPALTSIARSGPRLPKYDEAVRSVV